VVFLVPYAFERFVDRVARAATQSTRTLVIFVLALLLVPAVLIAL
jgi:hypothetical protein